MKSDSKKLKNRISDPKEVYSFWEESGFFRADPKSKNPRYSLLIPPPNLTGELYLGHAMQHAILDAIARFKRLQGDDVLLLPGVDHAGIQFEATFDKALSKKNLSKQKLGREKWLEEAWKFKEEIYKSVSATWRFLGLSADWSREVFTLDEGPKRAVFEEFKTYFEKGLIYRGPYIVQWCPKDSTAIEDVEMEYEERKEKLYFVKYQRVKELKSKSSDEYITVATTRPETIFADVAVAVYPNHPTYKTLVGQKVINPLTGKSIQVIEDKRVEKDFGTGALKITPGHDLLDFKIGRDHNLPIIQVVDKNGRMTENTDLEGMKVLEAKARVVEILREKGALVKEEDYVHNVGVCERCKTVVEPLISEEWFVKVGDLAREAVATINRDEIKFLPKNYKKIFVEWLKDIHDWCISRSLWWGHRIPVWYPSTSLRTSSSTSLRIRDKRHGTRDKLSEREIRISLDSPGKGWVQDEQVLDTWFSSGLWPMSTLGWGDESQSGKSKWNELSRYFPWDFEISAPEIKYLWIARMIMISKYFTGRIPFKTMFFHGMLRDLEGRKFSKSLGNGIDPNYLIEQWGVDATRMALYTYSIPGRDGRVSREILDERGKNFRNFGTKLRNIARFILELGPDSVNSVTASDSRAVSDKIASSTKSPRNDPAQGVILKESEESGDPSQSAQDDNVMTDNDVWILDELDKTTNKVTKNLENLELHLAVEEIYEFVWHKFADKYIEESKSERAKAQPALEHVLKQVLILLHPFMPFLTEEIYQKFETKRVSIMQESWPSAK